MAVATIRPSVTTAVDCGESSREPELYELLTVDEVAALLKVSRTWVYEHTRRRSVAPADRLPFVKIGKYVRFDPRAVRAFLARKCRAM